MDPKTKAAIAALVAVAALGVAGYLGYTALGGARTVRTAGEASADHDDASPESNRDDIAAPEGESGTARRVELDGPPPAWMEATQARAQAYTDDFAFPDSENAAGVFEDGAADLTLRAESDETLGKLGISARRGLVDAFRSLMQPLVSADKDAFERALRDLGAPDPAGGLGLYNQLSGYFDGARVALSAAQIRSVDPDQPGAMPMGMPDIPNMPQGATAIPLMIGVMEMRDDQTGKTTTIREVNIPLDAVFPGARQAALDGARTTEVWAPAQFPTSKGAKADLGPSIYFVFDDQNRAWRPVAMRVALASESAASRLETMMRRSRRRATED